MIFSMPTSWTELKKRWMGTTPSTTEAAEWAIQAIGKSEVDIAAVEDCIASSMQSSSSHENAKEELKVIRKDIKTAVSELEIELDDLSLSSSTSYKLQISVPTNVNYLMKAWAAAEGRDLSGIALQCLEIGLRELKSKGSIPASAVKRYDITCEKRLALAETTHLWEKHEKRNLSSEY